MKNFELKYGCNPNQKPAEIYMEDGSDLPIEILTGINKDISRLDTTAVSRLQWDLKNQFSKQLELLDNQINQIKEIIENGVK